MSLMMKIGVLATAVSGLLAFGASTTAAQSTDEQHVKVTRSEGGRTHCPAGTPLGAGPQPVLLPLVARGSTGLGGTAGSVDRWCRTSGDRDGGDTSGGRGAPGGEGDGRASGGEGAGRTSDGEGDRRPSGDTSGGEEGEGARAL
ncbi:hypothetical protein [Streptomyces sp. S.PNR 29]|uniref:hypothetical protein n=1 Tax=Streptomyces sp. S.PNR 29 TaxID=2973805 RepID=UPI0025AECFB1|nr:hypothetical protein [Streptomyces sp. S.PNR 29]MDN0197067.1 hypothetical protein [Streptomyces sp. S.PNR 29]